MTGCIYDPIFLKHGSPWHPESRSRLEAILQRLQSRGLWDDLVHLPFGPADEDLVTAVHREDYVEHLALLSRSGGGDLTIDTAVDRHTFDAAVMAAGGCIAAAEAVASGSVDNAICLVRPPGHHASENTGMGFCYLNNIALAAEHLIRAGVEKAAIIDWDTHHGNGTQDLFYDRPDVLYMSVHEAPRFPYSGEVEEMGVGEGFGYTINVPLPAGARDEHLLTVYEQLFIPALVTYRPEFVLVSAGYDGHWRDAMTGFELTAGGYYDLTWLAVEAADALCDGRICIVLEGGYDLPTLALGVENSVLALQGMEPQQEDEGPPDELHPLTEEAVSRALERAVRAHQGQTR